MLEQKYKKRKYRKKSRVPKIIAKIFISVFVILFLIVLAGVIYTWYMGLQQPIISKVEGVKDTSIQTLEHTQPSASTPEGVAIQSFTSPVMPGSNASITVRATHPYSKCTIKAEYNKVPSKDSGLIPKTTDDYGIVSWSWTVESTVPVGKWPVTVTCSKGKKSGMVIGDLVVKKQL